VRACVCVCQSNLKFISICMSYATASSKGPSTVDCEVLTGMLFSLERDIVSSD